MMSLFDIAWRFVLAAVVCGAVGPACAAPAKPKVLVIYSFNDLMPWQARIHAGLQERLAQIGPEVRPEIYEESVDSARIDVAVAGPALTAYLRAKYAGLKFDTVITESSAATHLLLASPDLFADAKRYAIDPGVDVPTPSSGIEIIRTQGDWARSSLLALSGVMPRLKRLVAITDRSAVGQTNKRKLLEAASVLPSTVTFEIWDDFTFDDLLDRSAGLPPDSAVFYTPTFVDRTGARVTPQVFARPLADRSAAPVFAYHDLFLGSGIVGGRLLSSQRVGAMMADLAAGAGHAERWADAEALLNPYMFDGAALRRWNIPDGNLPASAVVVGREPSIWQRYAWQIGAASMILLLEGCLILWLVVALRQRNAAVDDIASERDGLERKIAERTSELRDTARRLEVSNAHLRHLADTDALTALANRRKFQAVLEEDWRRTAPEEAPLCLLMIDVDRFKSVNDRHGHEAGDKVIRAVADVCRSAVGEGGCVGRLGGEEFAVLLPGSSLAVAAACAERIRHETRRLRIPVAADETVGVTVSIGLSWRLGASDSSAGAMARADAALYDAKHAGRDRVVCNPVGGSDGAGGVTGPAAAVERAA